MISLARGIPSPEMLPVEQLVECGTRALRRHGPVALNYGPPQGFGPLREWLGERHRVPAERVFLTPGSMMGLNLAVGHLASRPATAVVEAPTYDRMLGLLRRAGADVATVPRGRGGLDLDRLRELVERAAGPPFLYVMPTFHNPTGLTMTLSEREELVRLAIEMDITLVEDDPYGLLRVEGRELPRIHELMRRRGADHLCLLLSSFSKTVAPGLRVGYLIVPEAMVEELSALATSAYVSPPLLAQAQLYEFLSAGYLDEQLTRAQGLLRRRRDALLEAFAATMPADARWTHPEGGYFAWLELPEAVEAAALERRAREEGVTFVPGAGFFAGPGGERTARLSFSSPTAAEVADGAARLGTLVAGWARDGRHDEEHINRCRSG